MKFQELTELPIPSTKSIKKNTIDHSCGTYLMIAKASGYTTNANPNPIKHKTKF